MKMKLDNECIRKGKFLMMLENINIINSWILGNQIYNKMYNTSRYIIVGNKLRMTESKREREIYEQI